MKFVAHEDDCQMVVGNTWEEKTPIGMVANDDGTASVVEATHRFGSSRQCTCSPELFDVQRIPDDRGVFIGPVYRVRRLIVVYVDHARLAFGRMLMSHLMGGRGHTTGHCEAHISQAEGGIGMNEQQRDEALQLAQGPGAANQMIRDEAVGRFTSQDTGGVFTENNRFNDIAAALRRDAEVYSKERVVWHALGLQEKMDSHLAPPSQCPGAPVCQRRGRVADAGGRPVGARGGNQPHRGPGQPRGAGLGRCRWEAL